MNPTAIVVAGAVLASLVAVSPPVAGAPWLDAPKPPSWNRPGGAVPRAPASPSASDPFLAGHCTATLREPASAADRAVKAAGWQLFGAELHHGHTQVVLGQSGVDGMCRPRGYQVFVFSGGRFAGTLSPRPMDSRTDGAAQIPRLDSATHVTVVFSRYADADPLCCPSRLTTVEYRIAEGPKGPVVNPVAMRTEATGGAAPGGPAAAPSGPAASAADPGPAPGAAGACTQEPAAACAPSGGAASPVALRVWQLARIQAADGKPLVPGQPARYSLELGRDGRAAVRADCNRASGAYRLEGGALSFGPLAATRAACPPGSLSDRFLQELGQVTSYVERDGKLFLATRPGGAVLELQPAPGLDGVVSGAERCTRSGGTVGTASCCGLVGDFPNTCLVGACGCAPDQSHPVQVCRCPADRCFDGKSCVEPRPAPGDQLR